MENRQLSLFLLNRLRTWLFVVVLTTAVTSIANISTANAKRLYVHIIPHSHWYDCCLPKKVLSAKQDNLTLTFHHTQ